MKLVLLAFEHAHSTFLTLWKTKSFQAPVVSSCNPGISCYCEEPWFLSVRVTGRNQDMGSGWNMAKKICPFNILSLVVVGPLFLWSRYSTSYERKGYMLLLNLILLYVLFHINMTLVKHYKTTLEVVYNLYTTTVANLMTVCICVVTKMS